MDHKAFVFIEKNGTPIPAGRLVMTEDGRYSRAEFDYGRKYLQRPDATAIDPVQLPLSEEHLVTDPDFDLFNGLRDAAPDAWGRSLIDLYMQRAEGRPAMEAEYLLASQRGTRVGALQFGPTPERPAPVLDVGLPDVSSDLGTLEGFQEMIDLYVRGETVPDHLLDHVAPGSDLGGARPKGTIAIEGHPWLAKFGMDNDRINMAAAEAGCLDLCETAGLDVCERRVVSVAGRDTLLLKRFDREPGDGNTLNRRHMISGLTLLGAHEMDRGTAGYADLYDGLRRHGKVDGMAEDIYRRMIMNVLCGNTDDHFRNHAFLLNGDNRYEASPVYDVTPSLQVSTSRNLFLHLGRSGAGREATLDRAVLGAASLGIGHDRAVEIANDLSGMVARSWRDTLSARGASARDLELLENSFSEAGRRVGPDDPFHDTDKDPENRISGSGINTGEGL